MKKIHFLTIIMMISAPVALCQEDEKSKANRMEWPKNVTPPTADKIPYIHKAHGDERMDEYYWMNAYFKKGADSSRVLNYLEAENAYYSRLMEGTKELQDKLYNEMRSRIKEKDESVPYLKNGYYYYSRLVEGKDYFVFCRRKGSLTAPEEVLLDVNAMAEGHPYYSVAGIVISPDNNLLAYGVDTKSRRQYNIYVKDLRTGKLLKDEITNAQPGVAWAKDNKTFFYTSKNPETLLSEKIMRHTLGTESSKDAVVYHEKDPSNYIWVTPTSSEDYIIINSRATLSSEARYLDARKPNDEFRVFQPRMKEVLYNVDHAHNKFYLLTNKDAKNFRIMTTPVTKTSSDNWKDIVPHRSDVLVEDVSLFRDFVVVSERKDGLTRIQIMPVDGKPAHFLSFDEPAYMASVGQNPELNTDVLRFNYTSLTTPSTVYDYNMKTKSRKLMKQQEVLGSFKPSDYTTERVFATAEDGTRIPMSIVYRKGFKKDGSMPTLLYGYGSYGASMDAAFSSTRLSLLDRGFAFAIAHIRGGQEMGRYWYEDGKMFKKINTFKDFINAAEFLVNNHYSSPEHLYAMGGSAGGLLMGAVVNMRPDLFNGVIAAVPFVDVVTTMSDPTIPLTTNEYDEWGNPENKESYFYMKSYSPYDNVRSQAYPNMLITTGLHDSQVQYFEPAKWIARLRQNHKGDNVLMMYTDMSAGHGGASGRFKSLYDRAREYAFLLALEGKTR